MLGSPDGGRRRQRRRYVSSVIARPAATAAPSVPGLGPPGGPRRRTTVEGVVAIQPSAGPCGVVVDVGGDAERAAGAETVGEQVEDVVADEAPLVVASLGPRVGEEQVDTVQRAAPDAMVEHIERIGPQHVHVGGSGGVCRFQQRDDTRGVHVGGEHIDVGIGEGEPHRRLAPTATDLEDQGAGAIGPAIEVVPRSEVAQDAHHAVGDPTVPAVERTDARRCSHPDIVTCLRRRGHIGAATGRRRIGRHCWRRASHRAGVVTPRDRVSVR